MEDDPLVSEVASGASEKTANGSEEDKKTPDRKHWMWSTGLTVLSGIALTTVISRVPAPTRTFVAIFAAAGVLVVGGLVTLIVLIPAAGSNPDVKTEFYSARAAYLCVITGLLLFGVVAIGAVFARVMLNIGVH
jgi:hypothetical protein